MTRTKDLFMEQREFEAMQVTKNSIGERIKTITEAIEAGEIDPTTAFVQSKIMKDFADDVYNAAKDKVDLSNSNLPSNLSGVELSIRAGYETLDYEKDPVYADISKKLKEREGQLKAAYNNSRNFGGVITDEDGVVVPIVPVKSVVKDSVIVKY
jgi:hypothetical protein